MADLLSNGHRYIVIVHALIFLFVGVFVGFTLSLLLTDASLNGKQLTARVVTRSDSRCVCVCAGA